MVNLVYQRGAAKSIFLIGPTAQALTPPPLELSGHPFFSEILS